MRFILGILIAIGLAVLVLILIIKSLTGSGPKLVPKPLVDYASTSTSVQLLIDGSVQADQTHRAIQINVSQNQAQFDLLKGYQGNVLTQKTYASNQQAYAVFLRALDLQGFTRGNSAKAAADYRGYCPLGDRYVFQIIDGNGQTIQSFWSTSCGGASTFRGNASNVLALFQKQIPDFQTLTENVVL